MKKGALSVSILTCLTAIIFSATSFAIQSGNSLKAQTFIRNAQTGLPEFITGLKTMPMGKDSVKAARDFLQMHSDSLGIDTSMLGRVKDVKIGNMEHVKFQQMYKNVPVEGAQILVHMTSRGEVVGLFSSFQPDLDLDVIPGITADEAVSIVRQHLEITEDAPACENAHGMEMADVRPSDTDVSGTRGIFYHSLDPDRFHKPAFPAPELVIYSGQEEAKDAAGGEKSKCLAWKVPYSREDVGSWVYFIDAHTGRIILMQDARVNYSTEGTYGTAYLPNDGNDGLVTAPLPFSYVYSSYKGDDGDWYIYDLEASRLNGYYSVDWLVDYTWHDLCFELSGPKSLAMDSRTGYTGVCFGDYKWGLFTNEIPSAMDYTWNEDPYDDNSMFDSQNVYWHVNNSLQSFYGSRLDFDLGYQLECYTHVSSDSPHYDRNTRRLIFPGDVPGRFRKPAWARDMILHELQHAVTHEIYDSYSLANNLAERALDEAFSDYFASAQTADSDIGEWSITDPDNRRHLQVRKNMSQWDPEDYHKTSQIYSSALWSIRQDNAFSPASIDNLTFRHLFWELRDFVDACTAFMEEAVNQGYTTPQVWAMNYHFARQGLTHDLLVETFYDGKAEGWQTLSGAWHVSSSRSYSSPYSLAYSPQSSGLPHGDAILEIKHLDEFTSATLDFLHWYQTSCTSYSSTCGNRMSISVSTNGGKDWKAIFDSSRADLWKASWTSGTWIDAQYYFLPSELVPSLLVKFSFDSSDPSSNNSEGWYIDDISVSTNGPMY
jgi:Zn-dependent metalloprotease